MYFKLSFRNAKRSAGDYSLYITTLIILVSLMMLANLLTVASESTEGVQPSSLPLIITLVLAILLSFISIKIDVAVEKTKTFYATLPVVSETCSCSGCRNYEESFTMLSSQVINFFDVLGINM